MPDRNAKEKVKEQFSKNADKYVHSKTHANVSELTEIVEWIQPKKEWFALDIATGGGHVAKALSPLVSQVFATDLTKEMLANTARYLQQECNNISYIIADAEALPFLDHTFDLVTCRIAAHHFPNPKQFVQEVSRVLKTDGLFLFVDNIVPLDESLAAFMNGFEKRRDKSHFACLSKHEWLQLFSEAGLAEIESTCRKKTYDFPTWVKRTLDNKQEIDDVQRFILQAEEHVKEYFHVLAANNKVQSLQVDEWSILVKKT